MAEKGTAAAARERLTALQERRLALEAELSEAGELLDGALMLVPSGAEKAGANEGPKNEDVPRHGGAGDEHGDHHGKPDRNTQHRIDEDEPPTKQPQANSQQDRLRGGLIDREGFPTVDYGVAVRVRESRGRLARLQTDHIAVMKEIEKGLAEYHAAVRRERDTMGGSAEGETSAETSAASSGGGDRLASSEGSGPVSAVASRESKPEPEPEEPLPPPFARINSVEPNSPAYVAGLRAGDELCEFGSVSSKSGGTLQDVARLVPSVENREVRLVVGRPTAEGSRSRQVLRLRPQRWTGRGLIGCHLVPV
jgi:26S proteasome regulatory subunit N4